MSVENRVDDDWRLTAIARAAGQIINTGKSKVIFCNSCKVARLDGPEYCKCGAKMTPVRDVSPSEETLTSAMDVPISREIDKRQHELTFQGETLSIKAWATRLNWPVSTIYSRLREENRKPGSWPIEKLLTVPPRKKEKCSSVWRSESKIDGVPVSELIQATREEMQETPPAKNVVQLPATPANLKFAADLNAVIPGAAEVKSVLCNNDCYPKDVALMLQRCRRVCEIEDAITLLKQEQLQIISCLKVGA